MLTEDLKNKNIKLQNISLELKKKFEGIDNVIDQFINSVRVWYLMPELMTRPLIINLWGLTGSGKTDLVRSFVRMIEMSSSFIELQMDVGSSFENIQTLLECSEITPEKPSILLLDEFQRFKTKDEDGKDILKKSLQDVWMLLSDGRFQSDSDKKRTLLSLLWEDMYWNEFVGEESIEAKTEAENAQKQKQRKYKNSFYSAQKLKQVLNLKESYEEIMLWDSETKRKKVVEHLKDESSFEGKSYSQMLIIVAGNIDDAYTMASNTSNCDIDADIFHHNSKNINILSIKKALENRFKPEQISRLGNNHIIYWSLNKVNYTNIIKRKISDIIDNVYKIHQVKIIPDDSIYTTIYNNGVFPTQGVRPVISTIAGIFENCLPVFLFKAKENNINLINIRYDGSFCIGKVGDEIISCKVELSISNIKKSKNINDLTLTSIHEAGHAIAYAILKKLAPSQINTLTASDTFNGFVSLDSEIHSKRLIKDSIVIHLAGQAAEEIVFGDENKSTGAIGDIKTATSLAAGYIRVQGLDKYQSKITPVNTPGSEFYNLDTQPTNSMVEDMLRTAKTKALEILKNNKSLLKELSKELISFGECSPKRFVEICSNNNVVVSICPVESFNPTNYNDIWKDWVEID